MPNSSPLLQATRCPTLDFERSIVDSMAVFRHGIQNAAAKSRAGRANRKYYFNLTRRDYRKIRHKVCTLVYPGGAHMIKVIEARDPCRIRAGMR
jgi:hypothetical protein